MTGKRCSVLLAAVVAGMLIAPLTALHAAATPGAKPNILLIYSDDHGWADLGAQGADKDIRTPNLDRLAQDGVRFSRGYVTAPQCVPSRAGVLAGRYPQRFGVEDNSKGPLPLAELTIAGRLKSAGYVSGQPSSSAVWLRWILKASAALCSRPNFAILSPILTK